MRKKWIRNWPFSWEKENFFFMYKKYLCVVNMKKKKISPIFFFAKKKKPSHKRLFNTSWVTYCWIVKRKKNQRINSFSFNCEFSSIFSNKFHSHDIWEWQLVKTNTLHGEKNCEKNYSFVCQKQFYQLLLF